MAELLVTYMEATAPPGGVRLQAPRPDLVILRWQPKVTDYLDTYRAIGGPVLWDSRLRVPANWVADWLAKETSEVHALCHGKEVLGLCEFECVDTSEVELTHFGIVPRVQGLGFGSYLLDHALRDCWQRRLPSRIWLHTDTNDSPRAVSVYTKAGFRPYLCRVEHFDD